MVDTRSQKVGAGELTSFELRCRLSARQEDAMSSRTDPTPEPAPSTPSALSPRWPSPLAATCSSCSRRCRRRCAGRNWPARRRSPGGGRRRRRAACAEETRPGGGPTRRRGRETRSADAHQPADGRATMLARSTGCASPSSAPTGPSATAGSRASPIRMSGEGTFPACVAFVEAVSAAQRRRGAGCASRPSPAVPGPPARRMTPRTPTAALPKRAPQTPRPSILSLCGTRPPVLRASTTP